MPWVPDRAHNMRCLALQIQPTSNPTIAEARYLLATRAMEEIRWKMQKSPEFAASGSLQRALLDLEVLCECLEPEATTQPKPRRRKP